MKLLGIFSFFEKINLTNNLLVKDINDIFDFNLNYNHDNIKKLVDMEILDLKGNIIYFSDSILATYLFYFIFIDEKILDFGDLIKKFLQDYNIQINNKVYDTISAFGFENFKEKMENILEIVKNQLVDDDLICFYNLFYNFYYEEALFFIKTWLKNQSEEDYDFNKFEIPSIHNYFSSNPIIMLLKNLLNFKDSKIPLKLAMSIIFKKPSLIKDVMCVFKDVFQYNVVSIEHEFNKQHLFMDIIEDNNFNDNERVVVDTIFLFLLQELRLFDWHHIEDKQVSEFKVKFYEIKLGISDSLLNLRKRILLYLFKLYEIYEYDVNNIITSYINLICVEYKNIILSEQNLFYNFFKKLDFNNYMPNKLLYLYNEKLEKQEIESNFNFRFYNETIIKSIKLCSNVFENHRYKYEEIENKLCYVIKNNKKDYYINIFKFMGEIKYNEVDNSVKLYVDQLFLALIRLNLEIFVDAFSYYAKNDLQLLNSYQFIKLLFNQEFDSLKIYNLINKYNYIEKEKIKYFFFVVFPDDKITRDIFLLLNEFVYDCYEQFDFWNPNDFLKYNSVFLELKKELSADNIDNIIQYLTKSLIENSENFKIKFIDDFCRVCFKYFENNFSLLKECYFYNLKNNVNYDYSYFELECLCNKDKKFLNEYFEWRINNNNEFYKDNSTLSFIWELNYNYDDIESLIFYLVENCDFYYEEPISLLFSNSNHMEENFIKNFINQNYDNNKVIPVIFGIIREKYSCESFIKFFECFLKLNKSEEDFKKIIDFKIYLRGLYSEVDDLKKDLDLFLGIKDLLDDWDSSDYLGHNVIIINKIRNIQNELKFK